MDYGEKTMLANIMNIVADKRDKYQKPIKWKWKIVFRIILILLTIQLLLHMVEVFIDLQQAGYIP